MIDDPAAAFERPVGRPLDRLAHLIDLDRSGVAGLDQQHVRVDAARDPLARGADAARITA